MSPKPSLKREVNWFDVVFNLHVAISIVCGFHFVVYEAYYSTIFYSLILVILGILGVNAGAHRLWAHQSYKATTFLKLFLMICHTLTGYISIYRWVQLHRLHHKYFGTELDPYNPSKGFLHSHFVNNNLKLSEAQEEALKTIDMSDLENDKIVMFQKRFYWILFVIFGLILPVNAPLEYWDEGIWATVFVAGWLRYGLTFHLMILVNSAINIYDSSFHNGNMSDSNSVFFLQKSYWISYHYLTPWDYQTGEYGKYGTDCTSKFIRVCAALELASDLRTVDSKNVQDALIMTVEEKKPFIESIKLVENNLPDNHFLAPALFY